MAKVDVKTALAAVLNTTPEIEEAVEKNMAGIKAVILEESAEDKKEAEAMMQICNAMLNKLSNANKFVFVTALLTGLAGNRKADIHAHATILAAAMVTFHSMSNARQEGLMPLAEMADADTAGGSDASDPFAGIDTTKAN